jgi:chromosome segregation ATPase
MKNAGKQITPLLICGIVLGGIVAVSWQIDSTRMQKQKSLAGTDTVPAGRIYYGEDSDRVALDEAIKDLEIARQQVNRQIKQSVRTNLEQAQKTLAAIDAQRIAADVNRSLKDINWADIDRQVKESLLQVQDQLQQLNVQMPEIKIELEKVMAENNRINTEQLRLSLEQAKQAMKNIKLPELDHEVKKALQNAEQELQRAKAELQQMETFVNALDADGLINKHKAYIVEWKNDKLYINGTEQPASVTGKYRKYKKDGNYVLDNRHKEQL